MPPAAHVKQRYPCWGCYWCAKLSEKFHCLSLHKCPSRVSQQTNTREHPWERLNPCTRKHKLHTRCTYACTEPDAYTKQRSRLSLCFQLPHGPRGNQNFDTLCWKKEGWEARQRRRRTHAHIRARTHNRLRFGFRAGDSKRENMTLRGRKKTKKHWFLFLLHLSLGEEGRLGEGLQFQHDLHTLFHWMNELINAQRRVFRCLLEAVLYFHIRTNLIKVILWVCTAVVSQKQKQIRFFAETKRHLSKSHYLTTFFCLTGNDNPYGNFTDSSRKKKIIIIIETFNFFIYIKLWV